MAAAGILPFLVSAPRATLENFSGFSAGGAVSGATVLTLSGVSGTVASAVARDAPVLFAAAICVWALSRRGPWLRRPDTLVALSLACVSGRLVFESVVFPYYLLAPSVLFFVLDLVARRSPARSLAWCAAAAFFVALHPGNHGVAAFGTLIFALLAVAASLVDVARGCPRPRPTPARGIRSHPASPDPTARDSRAAGPGAGLEEAATGRRPPRRRRRGRGDRR